jgi:hypothetical protein
MRALRRPGMTASLRRFPIQLSNNGEGVTSHSRGTKCPSDGSSVTPENRGCRECRCSIAPAALRANEESTQASHHRYAETIRHSLRDGVSAAS